MSNLKISIQKLPKSQIELTVEISSADFTKYFDQAFSDLLRSLEIPGFRRGQVPKEIAKNYLPESRILEEAVKLAVRETFPEALLEISQSENQEIEPLAQPEIKILKGPSLDQAEGSGPGTKNPPLIYRAKFPILPEVKLPDYKSIAQRINQKNKEELAKRIEVQEKEIEKVLSQLQYSRAKYITVNRQAQLGDYVKIGSKLKAQDSKLDKVEELEGILGSGYFLPDFEKNLLGLRAGEQKTFSQKIPQNHLNKELAGKTLDFEVNLNLVQKVELPELNDEFAKSLGNFENFQQLKESIREGLELEKREKEKQKNREESIQEIVKFTELEIPDILLEKETERQFQVFKQNLENLGLNFEQYLQDLKKTEEDFKKGLRSTAENQIKIFLTLRKIAQVENIGAGAEEIKEKINEYLRKFTTIKEAEAKVDLEQLKLYYEDAIKNEKVFQLLEGEEQG